MFEKNLTDLIRGIRGNKKNEMDYIQTCIQEIREELKSPDLAKKVVAVQKLTYLQMFGYDMSWASFHCIEAMSSTRFGFKRIGYLAASQSYTETTDVITLATQLIRRDMTSASVFDAGVAINCLSNIATLDLARDLAADVVSLLNSSKPYVRKKAVLVLYKVFLKFPDALRPAFPRLKEKLEDSDPGVVSAAVNVICELARKNPKNYIALAPTLFKILTTSTNNWVLIKLVKLFGALLPIEPRLAKKLAAPLTNILNMTPAMSLLYETIQTCTIGMAENDQIIRLCISKLRTFVEESDPNLKYLGLLALNNIMKINAKAVAEHRDLVVNCLDDEDVTLRLRALDLLEGMVTKRNIADVIRKLLDHVERADGNYKDTLVEKIVNICSKNTYANIGTDFEWYISVLVELAHIKGTSHGEMIAQQFMDVIIRVKIVRAFGVKSTVALIRGTPSFVDNRLQGGNCEVLYAAAYVTGEFAEYIEDHAGVIGALLQAATLSLPPHIQTIYLQAATKVFAKAIGGATSDDEGAEHGAAEDIADVVQILQNRLPSFAQSQNLEVQERACLLLEMQRLYSEMEAAGTDIGPYIASLFDEPLNPVAPKAQKKVPMPEDLNLDEYINEPESDDDEPIQNKDFIAKYSDWGSESETGKEPERERVASSSGDEDFTKPARDNKHKDREGSLSTSSRVLVNNPYMLKLDSSDSRVRKGSTSEEEPPAVALEKGELGSIDDVLYDFKKTVSRGPRQSSGSSSRRGRRGRDEPAIEVIRDDDMPEGAADSDDEKGPAGKSSKDDLFGNIDLTTPLRSDEVLPQQTHRVVLSKPSKDKKESKDKEGSHRSSSGRSSRTTEKDGDKERHHSSRHGDSHRSSERSKDESKDSKGKDAKHPKVASLIDLDVAFDDVPSAPSTPSTSHVDAVSAMAANAARSGSSSHRSSGSSSKERDHKGKEGSSSSRHSSSRHHSDSKSSSSRSSSRRSEDKHDSTKPPPKFRTLVRDDDLTVSYELRTNAKESKKIMAAFQLKNTGKEPVSSVEFSFHESMNTRVAPGSALKPAITVAPGETATHNIIFEVQSFKSSQRSSASVSYQAGGSTHKRDGHLHLPCSAFVMPIKLEKDAYVSLLRDQASSLSMNSVTVPVRGDFKAFVVTLAHLLHVELILMDKAASLYGRTIQNHHVAVYAIASSGGNVQVDLKCSDSELGAALAKEVSSYFQA